MGLSDRVVAGDGVVSSHAQTVAQASSTKSASEERRHRASGATT
jgi:hypothetical protein